jgi:hypothetical protein
MFKSNKTLLDEALRYASFGYRVFPCAPREKFPATEHGCLDATTDEDQIEKWWTEQPDANIGISTEGLLVLDIDKESRDWPKFEQCIDLARAPATRTANCGRHYIVVPDKGLSLTCGMVFERVG